ncbi:dihydrodipicolinate synthase family protein [Subtercola lobariae]|uniref:4-hydroxy-tetrahydrodipicolinate synthase n=1 Tax=Subtercola lobariae TaxID=1588641 RepID=A0A917BAX3_9MICO|nr:dihydrodipicolinate synthase family protein [Subtercola lobariae]GGF31729.1 4-hydroxy-tetrahydrodipicolinate synthase [Subtercola lobariae]
MQATPLQPGSYVMGLTPFDSDGRVDEAALRDHIEWMARENIGYSPASPATGEGVQMSDAELFRVLEVSVDAMAARLPVIASNREFPTALQNVQYADRAAGLGADAVQLYPPTLGHSSVPTVAMFEAFYDEVLSATSVPIVLSSNFMTGFEIPTAVLDTVISTYPSVVGVFKHHPDQQNVAQFVQQFAPRTTVLTMTQRLMFSGAVGAQAELDNLQNVAPRLCRGLHDAIAAGDLARASDLYQQFTRLWGAIMGLTVAHSVPRVVVYKAILGLLGRPGWHARKPYVELPSSAHAALARLVDELELRSTEALV